MVSKLLRCMMVLKYIPEPTTRDYYNISRDVDCNIRQVYRALDRLRKGDDEVTKMVREVMDLRQKMSVLYRLMNTKMEQMVDSSLTEIKVVQWMEENLG